MDDYGARIRRAYRDWHDAHDPERMSWAQVQRKVADLLGVPTTSVAVLLWKDGRQRPDVPEFRALGTVLEADPRVLAFGPEMPQESPKDREVGRVDLEPVDRPSAAKRRHRGRA